MICTRCGIVQRRETARFCHQCGATIEPAPAAVQSDISEIFSAEWRPQPSHTLRPVSLSPREPGEREMAEQPASGSSASAAFNTSSDAPPDSDASANKATLRPAQPRWLEEQAPSGSFAPQQPEVDYPQWYEETPAPPQNHQGTKPRQLSTRTSAPDRQAQAPSERQ